MTERLIAPTNLGEPFVPKVEPQNLLERAAMMDSVDAAAKLIQDALGITDGGLAGDYLTWPERWAKLAPWKRLDMIGNWLRGEALQCIDMVEGEHPSDRGLTND
jgi:hypothetical protein